MPTIRAIIFFFLISTSILYSQENSGVRNNDLRKYFQFDNPHPLACLFTYFPSIFIQHELELKSFVRSKTFKHLREQFGDAKSVDAIYVRAMQLTNNNTAISLLLSTFATFDHETVGLNVPFFSLAFPLTDESGAEFRRRVNNLPRIIYDDSPESGDRDKLQHFFGSAFLTFISESRDAADRFGTFVEKGERLVNRRWPSLFFTHYPTPLKTESDFPQRPWEGHESSEFQALQYSSEGP
jgi:hypothetical protein